MPPQGDRFCTNSKVDRIFGAVSIRWHRIARAHDGQQEAMAVGDDMNSCRNKNRAELRNKNRIQEKKGAEQAPTPQTTPAGGPFVLTLRRPLLVQPIGIMAQELCRHLQR